MAKDICGIFKSQNVKSLKGRGLLMPALYKHNAIEFTLHVISIIITCFCTFQLLAIFNRLFEFRTVLRKFYEQFDYKLYIVTLEAAEVALDPMIFLVRVRAAFFRAVQRV